MKHVVRILIDDIRCFKKQQNYTKSKYYTIYIYIMNGKNKESKIQIHIKKKTLTSNKKIEKHN